jgi:hypothetical protein
VKKILQAPRAQAVIARLAALYIQGVARALRWRVAGEPSLAEFVSGPPMIVVFWHETLPAMPVLWLLSRRRGLARSGWWRARPRAVVPPGCAACCARSSMARMWPSHRMVRAARRIAAPPAWRNWRR